MVNPEVDAYIERSDKWPEEMVALRPILLGCGLDESIKWGKPCYSHDGSNIVIMQEMNDYLSLMFFKGALMKDPERILRAQGPNSRSALRVEFTSVDDVTRLAGVLADYIGEAIDVAEAGLEVEPPPQLVLVDELRSRFDEDPALEKAFDALTPGRQREYNLYFAGAKQATTRAARIEKYSEKILSGKGLRDR